MELNNVHCVYFSPTGNTKKSVISVTSAISNRYVEKDLTKSENRGKTLEFNSNDIVVVGVPVYGGRIPLIKGGLLSLKGNNTPVIAVVNYGNREYEDSLLELSTYLHENGFKVIAAAAFLGEHSYTSKVGENRPDSNDIKDMKEFGERIKKRILDNNLTEVKVDGNYPFKERKESPKYSPCTRDNCIDCMMCRELCPVDAIDDMNPRLTDKDKCIKCCACIKGCPANAKYMDNETYTYFVNFLEENCIKRKQPSLFI
ncbi:MAG: EFR1 family ferrodoxin [Clostridium sp.]